MPQSSRYSDEQIEHLLLELVKVLEKYKAPTDLSLIVLGNMVANLINTTVTLTQHKTIAESLAQALLASVNEEKIH
ncbi:hypothetical protein ARAF_0563 [Arsenophonus endosymbiont of Aleurodicus floccissimus]|uniref:DUF1414 domain-containing protein n=1 Tax=Arsenophonus endosymbiont of Aleurodicus floccissimus TaxID=2152761 RepID=UPI000E6B0AF9|nr:DUF1414 domain-containing protein [Arsenophonus endosymbiont of Aleurodicus floccissimus]SPP31437.1 hypothetical protein ARAF_0563 [Arsenophonus endosymbiont of Aleurodicus floccissimus]